MNKLIAIVAALATTSSLYAASAEAGCGGHGLYRSSYRSVARTSKPRLARKQSSTSVAAVAKQETKDESKKVAEAQVETKADTAAAGTAPVREKTSTAAAAKTAEVKPADAKADARATEKVATAATDCKQFFPSAGVTLSVRCE